MCCNDSSCPRHEQEDVKTEMHLTTEVRDRCIIKVKAEHVLKLIGAPEGWSLEYFYDNDETITFELSRTRRV